MTKKIGVAAMVGLLALSGFAGSAFAQCGTGVMIDWDANSFAYETNYTPATFNSAAGSQLTVVGIVNLFCSPFLDLNPNSATTEYTFVFDGLVSGGTTTQVNGPSTVYTTNYGSGAFRIYEGTPRNAPTAGSMPAGPPNATVPANFADGTLILSGTLSAFSTQITRVGTNPPNGSFRADYTFTGGSLFSRVQNTGAGLMQGLWCVTTGCTPSGYSAHPDGKFDNPPTAVLNSTWGAIKDLYR